MAAGAVTLALIAQLLSPLPAWSGEGLRFDLDCTAPETDATSGGLPTSRKARYSIDLRARLWCATATCDNPRPILRLFEGQIVLDDDGSRVLRRFLAIERSKDGGTLTLTSFRQGSWGHRSLTCVKAPFTPMPAAANFKTE